MGEGERLGKVECLELMEVRSIRKKTFCLLFCFVADGIEKFDSLIVKERKEDPQGTRMTDSEGYS